MPYDSTHTPTELYESASTGFSVVRVTSGKTGNPTATGDWNIMQFKPDAYNDYGVQIACQTNSPQLWLRRLYAGNWSPWTQYANVTTGTMVVACNAGKTQISYANLPSGKPSSQGVFLQSLYQCVNHGSAAEITTVCIDGVDLIIQTATAQNVTIRWFYFGTV